MGCGVYAAMAGLRRPVVGAGGKGMAGKGRVTAWGILMCGRACDGRVMGTSGCTRGARPHVTTCGFVAWCVSCPWRRGVCYAARAHCVARMLFGGSPLGCAFCCVLVVRAVVRLAGACASAVRGLAVGCCLVSPFQAALLIPDAAVLLAGLSCRALGPVAPSPSAVALAFGASRFGTSSTAALVARNLWAGCVVSAQLALYCTGVVAFKGSLYHATA